MEPQLGQVEVLGGRAFVGRSELFPVGRFRAIFDVVHGRKVVVEYNVILRRDKSCFGVKYKGDVTSMLR